MTLSYNETSNSIHHHREGKMKKFKWQDWVIMVGCFVLGFALIPSIVSEFKPAFSTCVMSTVILAMFTISFATLKLWLSTIAEGFACLMWFVLLVQTI